MNLYSINNKVIEGDQAIEYYNYLMETGHILFECVVGSQAYGTNIGSSDVDKKFIYIDPKEVLYSNRRTDQINVNKDYVGFEICRFFELLTEKQSPNMHELIHCDEKFILYKNNHFYDWVLKYRNSLLTSKIAYSYGSYGLNQIKKAQGTNKKFMNPMPKEKKTIKDFIWMPVNQGSQLLFDYLNNMKIDEKQCGLVAIPHMKDTYHLFISYTENKYRGIIDKDGVQVILSSTEKEDKPRFVIHVNYDGFKKYNKEYKEYWEWDEKKNIDRYANNLPDDKKYDKKNMMHCHRLLNMCKEMLNGEGVNVYRKDRDYLLSIRLGDNSYQELLDSALAKNEELIAMTKNSTLPDTLDTSYLNSILSEIRGILYKSL